MAQNGQSIAPQGFLRLRGDRDGLWLPHLRRGEGQDLGTIADTTVHSPLITQSDPRLKDVPTKGRGIWIQERQGDMMGGQSHILQGEGQRAAQLVSGLKQAACEGGKESPLRDLLRTEAYLPQGQQRGDRQSCDGRLVGQQAVRHSPQIKHRDHE